MRVHPNNTVWLNSIGNNEVIRLDPATRQFTFFDVPAGVKRNRNATPYGIAVGGDNKSGSWRIPSTRLRASTP